MLKYNSSIKFPDRQTLEDLIDYVNSDMTNKFTLVINKTISRPDTSFKGQLTPSRIQSGVLNLPPIDRKTSRSLSQSNAVGLGDDSDILMTSMNDDVFKVESFKIFSMLYSHFLNLQQLVFAYFFLAC